MVVHVKEHRVLRSFRRSQTYRFPIQLLQTVRMTRSKTNMVIRVATDASNGSSPAIYVQEPTAEHIHTAIMLHDVEAPVLSPPKSCCSSSSMEVLPCIFRDGIGCFHGLSGSGAPDFKNKNLPGSTHIPTSSQSRTCTGTEFESLGTTYFRS